MAEIENWNKFDAQQRVSFLGNGRITIVYSTNEEKLCDFGAIVHVVFR